MPIRLLPDHVANKIAAGEVVERPASVLKELMENALDAGATEIEVELLGGGRRLIRVTDNGSGMSRDDALMSVERHATSKIRDVDDIERVHTLGFRGEALAAISSVSRFELTTRPQDALSGTTFAIAAGRMTQVTEAGAPPGTSILVRNLFFNVPARRKFLRTDQTELAHARQVFLVHALAHPETGFRLVVEEKEVYRLAPGATLDERIRQLFGARLLESLKPVRYADIEAHVSGYAGLARISRADRNEQYIFVNGRPAGAAIIGHAIREAYNTILPKGRHPVLFLFLEVDPEQVDVNVHPTKKEVRFRHPREVRDAVMKALDTALREEGAAAENRTAPWSTPAPAQDGRLEVPRIRIADLPQLQPFAYPREEGEAPASGERPPGIESGGNTMMPETEDEVNAAPWNWCRIMGQAGGLYVVMETDGGMVLMDPHAAHERVLFERFMKQLLRGSVRSQGLLVPESVDLSPQDMECVQQHMDLLRQMGFGMAEFGGDTVLVDALPACLGNVSATSVLGQVARSLEEAGPRGGTERFAEERVAKAACKAAVKANDLLKVEEIEQLVVDLARADMPYTCPHGRPTIIFMSYRELNRKFGRE
jgi:DNA mismatch repair protein MutL